MQENKQALVKVDNLSLAIDDKTILDQVNLNVHRGEIVTLIGPNGAGKSCLLKCILGLMSKFTGSVEKASNIQIGYTPQSIQFDPILPLTVEQFMRLGQKRDIDVHQALFEVGAQSLQLSWMYQLSGGETQRVLLARALSQNPDLLVLDEPAQGVDIIGQGEVYKLLAKIRTQRQCGILVVSHDLSLVMAETDTVICLNQHICCHGHPKNVAMNPEFKRLFGEHAQGFALYTHKHDHHHSIDGSSKEDDHD